LVCRTPGINTEQKEGTVKNKILAAAAATAILTLGFGGASAFADADPTPAPTPAVVATVSVWHTWLVPSTATGVVAGHQAAIGASGFPQPSVGVGQIAPACGTTVQQDEYTGTPAQVAAVIAEASLTWTDGHASDQNFGASVADWYIVSGAACVTPPPPPAPPATIACVASSTPPANEAGDLPPTVDAVTGNLDFNGPTAVGQAEDWYYRVTAGEAKSLTGKYITYTGTSVTFPAQAVVEVSAANFPGSGFGTLSTNIAAADAHGTINLDTNGTWYTSKIASGPGSLAWVSTGNSETYAQLVSLIGVNHLLSDLSLHLQSNSPASAHSAVSAVGSICSAHVYTKTITTTPPTTPTPLGQVNTGDVNPIQPWMPVMLFAVIAALLGSIVLFRKTSAIN
jgi:hypothetical protein